MQLTQINLQPYFGGGEVYTAFLCRALDCLGVSTTLYIHPEASFWAQLGLPVSTQLIHAKNSAAIISALPRKPLWLLSHGPQTQEILAARNPRWLLTAMAHMPLQGRNPRSFSGHDMVFPVSDWVREGLIAVGASAWKEPLYGVATLENRCEEQRGHIVKNSRFDWDQRKFRDRLLGLLQPLVSPFTQETRFNKRPGLTLGIVSRLTPIKQFPLLFSHLVPVLARHPSVNLEIFGSGGYASVRDFDKALSPIAHRVRFWGHQRNVGAVYSQLDYLMTGLPEKEALGLNIIEAQACDLPVLAVNAPPFTETVLEGQSGFFYRDPREDQGADFSRLLYHILSQSTPLHPVQAKDHLARFSFDAFVGRLRPVIAWVGERLR